MRVNMAALAGQVYSVAGQQAGSVITELLGLLEQEHKRHDETLAILSSVASGALKPSQVKVSDDGVMVAPDEPSD